MSPSSFILLALLLKNNSAADFLGRRWAMIAESLLVCVGLVVQMAAFSVWQQIAVGRFIAGLGIGALSAAVPIVSNPRVLSVTAGC